LEVERDDLHVLVEELQTEQEGRDRLRGEMSESMMKASNDQRSRDAALTRFKQEFGSLLSELENVQGNLGDERVGLASVLSALGDDVQVLRGEKLELCAWVDTLERAVEAAEASIKAVSEEKAKERVSLKVLVSRLEDERDSALEGKADADGMVKTHQEELETLGATLMSVEASLADARGEAGTLREENSLMSIRVDEMSTRISGLEDEVEKGAPPTVPRPSTLSTSRQNPRP
jgi:chromosome segregation ATPase